MLYEVLIIGAGPAAFSAAIFLARAGVKVFVIGQDEQSGLNDATEVHNYPGFPKGIAGRALLDNMIEQAKKEGAVFKHGEVTHAEQKEDKTFKIKTADLEEFEAKNLVLAHGAFFMKVNLPGEDEYKNKGVYYCSTCDGPLFKGRKVLVLGNGNLAAEEALELSGYVQSVKIVSHASSLNFSPGYKQVLLAKQIQIREGRATEFKGDGAKLISVLMADDLNEEADAVFIAQGVATSQTFANALGLELEGQFVKVDGNMRTSLPNVWAIGLARGGTNQIVKSVGDGGVAAVDIIKQLKGLPQYIDHT